VKRTELEKNKFLKVNGRISQSGAPGRFGSEAGAVLDRREQRKHDQALGLVPFAVKLDGDLVKQVQALAQTRQVGLNEVVAELLKKGLEGG
jgi:predicted deacylase